MPTGYTAPVESGEITDLRPFALRCARAFGTFMFMRDEPLDAEVDWDRIEDTLRNNSLSDIKYHRGKLAEAEADLEALMARSDDEVREIMAEEFADGMARWQKSEDRRISENAKYEGMLDKVHQWEPPTPDHENLKKFMVQQLEASMWRTLSMDPPDPDDYKDVDVWRQNEVEHVQRSLSYHKERIQKAEEALESHVRWVKDLVDSLPA